VAAYYDVELADEKANYRAEVFELVPKVIERCLDVQRDGCVDFDDMVWLPVALDLPMTRYDLLCVDEAQDLNRCQQALAKKSGHRLILVGDPKQAIYGFAGADAQSMGRMKDELNATDRRCVVLPLTETRRCGRRIVAEANKYVKDFTAHASNPEGTVTERDMSDYHAHVSAGDMVLCRVNAPLVSQCFRFIKAGRKANIQGRDVAAGLKSTIKKTGAKDVVTLVAKVSDWLHAETTKEQAKRNPSEQRIIALTDRADCILCFTENCDTVDQVIARIDSVFTDDRSTPGIRMSSIHRAKGLESARVFLLQPKGGCVPHPMAKSAWSREQETHLLYVAITRAIEELVYVYESEKN
jgi:superfamily I DNA/RNA helicase